MCTVYMYSVHNAHNVHLQCTVLHTEHGPHPFFYFPLGPTPLTTAVAMHLNTTHGTELISAFSQDYQPPKLVDFEAFSVFMCFGNPQQVEWCYFNIWLDFWHGMIISQFHQPTFKWGGEIPKYLKFHRKSAIFLFGYYVKLTLLICYYDF